MPFTLAQMVQSESEIRKSRFVGIALPVTDEHAIRLALTEHFDPTASHQCWASKLGQDVRWNDAGEPGGTAGRPILAAIEGQDLTNVLVIVNRWFGGIKLGTGGLMRAYGTCAGQTLQLAEKIPLIDSIQARTACEFRHWPTLQYWLSQQGMQILEQAYDASGIHLEIQLLPEQLTALQHYVQDLTRGRQLVTVIDERS